MRSKKKIMVIDDDEAILDVVSIMLEQEGYEVIINKGNNISLTNKDIMPDLILLDVRLSGIDGRTICKNLKASELLKSLPVILFSANADIKEIAASCGADGYVAKPFNKKTLVGTIGSTLQLMQ
ncbi:MAG: response regulator receiver protein [Chitinophagaceae bacterium]|nr:response regulator receiver protein [Chitinophagaceae bacterium]